ncbi:MAG: hypothetical protein OHK0039_11270 [Bacteroidia bacterium]
MLPVSYKSITVDDRYTLQVPDYLKETKALSDEMPLQYENRYQELYLIGQYQSRSDLVQRGSASTLEGLFDFHLKNLQYDLEEIEVLPADTLRIGGLPAIRGGLKGHLGKDHIAYRLVVIEGETYVYQLLLWTLADRSKQIPEVMDSIALSFRELRDQ